MNSALRTHLQCSSAIAAAVGASAPRTFRSDAFGSSPVAAAREQAGCPEQLKGPRPLSWGLLGRPARSLGLVHTTAPGAASGCSRPRSNDAPRFAQMLSCPGNLLLAVRAANPNL